MSNSMMPISPELALVDPDLAAAARALLPDPPDCLSRRLPLPLAPLAASSDATPASPARGSADVPRLRDPRRALRSVATAGAWIVLAGVVASPLLAFLPPNQAPSIVNTLPQPAPPPTAPPLPKAPSGSARVDIGPTIRWRAVPGASLYNLILVDGSRRVDLWSMKPSVRVTRPQRAGARLTPIVTYAWFVYPVFRSSSGKLRFGTVTAHGSIAVRSGTLRASV